jgi:hypothetical protein
MRQLMLVGTKRYAGQTIVVWADVDLDLGDTVRWNGSPWRVGSAYGTRLCLRGYSAAVRERPTRDADSLN